MRNNTSITPGLYCLRDSVQTQEGLADHVVVTFEGEARLANLSSVHFQPNGLGCYTPLNTYICLTDKEGNFIPAPQGWDNWKPNSVPTVKGLPPLKVVDF